MNNIEKQQTTGRRPPKRADDANAQIAMKLRTFYRSVQEETLPQRFLDLLEKLDAVENRIRQAE